MSQKNQKQPPKIDPLQSFEAIFEDMAKSLKSDVFEGILDDTAAQTKLQKATHFEKNKQEKGGNQEKSASMAKRILGEKVLVDLGIERKKKETEDKQRAEIAQIEQLTQEIKQIAEIENSKAQGAVEQLQEVQIEIAQKEQINTKVSVEQGRRKKGIGDIIFEKLRLSWLREKADSSKSWMQTGNGKRQRSATGMEVFVKGKQMQGLEQQVWQHQG